MPRTPHPKKTDDGEGPLRLNRFLARAGHGSRRSVEALVDEGRVSVNGEVVRDLAVRIDPGRDRVTVDGMPAVMPRGFRVYAFHKPIGIVSTLRTQGRQKGLAPLALRAGLPERFKPVGRLDVDSAGLLLWTDDGDLSQALLRPRSEVWKRYDVVLARPLVLGGEKMLSGGVIVLDGRPVRPCRLEADAEGDRRHWTLELHEGRKRQIRRMMAAAGAKVIGLTRIAIGPVQLGHLKPGGFRRLSPREEDALRRVAGLTVG